MMNMSNLISLAVFALMIVALAGQYYLTQFAFNSYSVGDDRTYKLTDVQLRLARIAIVVFWINFGLALLAGVMTMN